MWCIEFLEQTLHDPLKIQTLVDQTIIFFLLIVGCFISTIAHSRCAIEEGSIAETSVKTLLNSVNFTIFTLTTQALGMLATQAYQTALDCALMHQRHPKLMKRALFKKLIHLVMLRNEAIYSVIYRNSKIWKKSRHILAYCTNPLLTSVLIVCHSSLHAETLNCCSIRNKACLFCLQQTRLVTRNFYLVASRQPSCTC